VATERLSLTAQGEVRYALKTPYRDGATHVVFEPEDFLSRLAALVPSPRVNLTRFHGVFAPHHRLRVRITARRSDRTDGGAGRGSPRASAMGWVQRLKRVFSIDVERCDRCGGAARIHYLLRRARPRAHAQRGAPMNPIEGGRRGIRGAVQDPPASLELEPEEFMDFTAPHAIRRREHLVERWFILPMRYARPL